MVTERDHRPTRTILAILAAAALGSLAAYVVWA
jgi:hypothetical protein